ncbi:hypothetical protein HU200_010014 [Digitaria exilis]|uniref:Uncharacterized protein n=1 Tax=Digitaria exilis TaxID=1010633 RepID=A0A835KS31_9POAL|nr:hypothetical protein HU200_010014 [Digitaria exilis]CAB3487616.1 unnamed protein product [Digitaria exilis]
MGCALACFGGDGNRRGCRWKSWRHSPARSPPRSIHVTVPREAANVVVKGASLPLRGAKPSMLAEALEVQDELSSQSATAAKEASLQVSSPPSAVVVADEAVTDASSSKALRKLIEQTASPVCSFLTEKQVTPPFSPVKCSPVVAAIVSPQDSIECSPVVAAVVYTPVSELREVSEHGSRSSGKQKVTFDLNVTTYENAVLADQEEPPEEGEKHTQKTVVLPENHCYQNCSDSDDDVEDEYAEDDVYDDGGDEKEDDFMDCKVDLADKEEVTTEENKQESHESLFSLSMSNDQQNDQEVTSSAPKNSGTSADVESPLITRNNLRDRSQYVHPMLNPVRNLSQWKELKESEDPSCAR